MCFLSWNYLISIILLLFSAPRFCVVGAKVLEIGVVVFLKITLPKYDCAIKCKSQRDQLFQREKV